MTHALDRRTFAKRLLATTTAATILLGAGRAISGEWPSEGSHIISNHDGYTIDKRFVANDSALLKSAMKLFYERFCQAHYRVIPELETQALHMLDKAFPYRDYLTGAAQLPENHREFLVRQFIRMGKKADKFPHVNLEYAHENADWLARAHVGTVKVYSALNDDFRRRFDGSFEMEINSYYLNTGGLYRNPAYWAGVIAHEALHNLGHRHPHSRSDADYYNHQMIVVEHLVMTDGKARYGQKNPTPVLCMPRP